MNTYQVWIEGFAATGQSGAAQYLGAYKADSFLEACELALFDNGFKAESFDIGDDGVPRYCGCRMFDNETEAREAFG